VPLVGSDRAVSRIEVWCRGIGDYLIEGGFFVNHGFGICYWAQDRGWEDHHMLATVYTTRQAAEEVAEFLWVREALR
jgi:hypothetical protein